MLPSLLYVMLKLSKPRSPQKLFDYDCVTLYVMLKGSVHGILKLKIWGYPNFCIGLTRNGALNRGFY